MDRELTLDSTLLTFNSKARLLARCSRSWTLGGGLNEKPQAASPIVMLSLSNAWQGRKVTRSLLSLVNFRGGGLQPQKPGYRPGFFIYRCAYKRCLRTVVNEKAHTLVWAFVIGRDDKIRTCDPLHPMQVRYRAALHPDVFLFSGICDTFCRRHGIGSPVKGLQK